MTAGDARALRDAIEDTVRAWHRMEVARGGIGVIEFDCHPEDPAHAVPPATDRLAVYERLHALRGPVADTGELWLTERLDADLAYLSACLGERPDFGPYVRATQGCGTAGWPADYVEHRGAVVRAALADLGVAWGPDTERELMATEGLLPAEQAGDAIVEAAAGYERAVREAADVSAEYRLSVESVDIDAYWSYWLDGAGQDARMRINVRNARFTHVRARQFALHEVLGHALQCAAFAERCAREDVPWVRLISIHAPTAVLLEGLAQALPLVVAPDDTALATRVRLDHYLQLVRSELHLAINSGASVRACAAHARARVPFWTDRYIGDVLADRANDPRLRTYQWSYPAGLDWFVVLAETDPAAVTEVLHAAYRDPLTPRRLAELSPLAPPVGGPGPAVRLREPEVP